MKIALGILFYLGGYIAMHIFVHREISKGLELKKWVRGVITIVMILAASLLITSRILDSFFNTKLLFLIGASWFGIMFSAFTIFVIKFILRLIFKKHDKTLTISAIALTVILVISSMFISLYGLRVREIELRYKNLPPELDGVTIVQLSDLHLSSITSEKWFANVIEKTNALNPDIVVITGDLMDSNICNYENYCNIIKKIKAKKGVFAVPGNHEYYAGFENFMKIQEKSNVRILVNENFRITEELFIAGIDDLTGKRTLNREPDIKEALKDISPGAFIILLSHRPEYFDEAVEEGIQLVLAGHTHAGQIFPNDLFIRFYMKYHYGLYKRESSYLYTTSGTGTWGPPMRLFTRSEIVKITLRKK